MRSFGETPGKREALLNKLVKLQETPVKREETPEKGEEPLSGLCVWDGSLQAALQDEICPASGSAS